MPASGTEAIFPVELAQTDDGAVTVQLGRALTVTALPLVQEQPLAVMVMLMVAVPAPVALQVMELL